MSSSANRRHALQGLLWSCFCAAWLYVDMQAARRMLLGIAVNHSRLRLRASTWKASVIMMRSAGPVHAGVVQPCARVPTPARLVRSFSSVDRTRLVQIANPKQKDVKVSLLLLCPPCPRAIDRLRSPVVRRHANTISRRRARLTTNKAQVIIYQH